MRALVCGGLLVGAATRAAAEPPIRVDVGGAMAWSRVPDRRGGAFTIEIKGVLSERLAVGGRVDIALLFGGRAREDVTLDLALAACGLVDGELTLAPGPVRPFVGLGVGAYTLGSQTVVDREGTTRIDSETGTYLGVAPQLGVDLGRVRLAATYHAILGAELALRDVATGQVLRELSQHYASVELTFRVGDARPRR